jgi:hypothetical protein
MPRQLLGWTEENHKKKTVKMAAVPAEIQTKYIPNTSLEHYRYTNRVGVYLDLPN